MPATCCICKTKWYSQQSMFCVPSAQEDRCKWEAAVGKAFDYDSLCKATLPGISPQRFDNRQLIVGTQRAIEKPVKAKLILNGQKKEMLLLRQVAPFMRVQTRLYVKKVAKTRTKMNLATNKQVHEEIMRHINPYARINISSEIGLRVQSADVHEYPDADAFIATLHGGQVKNCTASIKVDVSDDERQVDVVVTKLADSTDFHCELEVPVRAELHISSKDKVSVKNMYCAAVVVQAKKNINTKEIRADTVKLESENGHIRCEGMLLGQSTTIETKASGNVALDKLQGDHLICKTDEGNVSVNSCYVEASKFETNSGSMDLKNVHKKVEVNVHKQGNLKMSGVHGNISAYTNGGDVNLQLSELVGENVIKVDKAEQAIINISDTIEEKSSIEVASSGVILDSSLSHLSDCISEDNKLFRMAHEPDAHSKLKVRSNGSVKLGKLSWVENLRASMGVSND